MEYKPVSETRAMMPVTLSSGAQFTVPSVLDFGDRVDIESESSVVTTDTKTGKPVPTTDYAKMGLMVVQRSLLHPKTHSNLTKNGERIQFTEDWILHELQPKDGYELASKLMAELLGVRMDEESADPNEPDASETKPLEIQPSN